MTQTTETNLQRIEPEDVRQQLTGKHVCPFCGVIRADQQQPCPRCTMEDTGATRSATRQRIGPWFVLQARNPSAPGMKFATLLTLVRKGHVTPRSIVRGPTTHQLWTFAARVRGVSREFGLCWHCGEQVATGAIACAQCERKQEPPTEPDALLEGAVPPPPAPELQVTAAASPETGMDGGTSLDLQVDSAFTEPARPVPLRPRPERTAMPSVSSTLPVSRQVPATAPATSMAIVPSRNPSAAAKEEAILSARELAAAFQLDFKAPGARGSRGGFFKTVVALLLIAIIAVGIVMAIRPDMREKSVAWLDKTWESIKSSLEQPASNGTQKVPEKLPPKPTPKIENPKIVETPKPELPKPEQRLDPVIPPKPVTPRPDPAPIDVKPTPPPPVTPAPVTPRPVPPPAVTPAPETATTDMTIPQATALGAQLRSKALDAEADRRWDDAISYYEQIMRLPREAWPTDVSQRLDRVRNKAKQPGQ